MIFHKGDSWNYFQSSVGSVFELKKGDENKAQEFLSSYTLNSASVFHWKWDFI